MEKKKKQKKSSQKVKTIYWEKEVKKATGPIVREKKNILKKYSEEARKLYPNDVPGRIKLWNEKYGKKYSKIDKRMDETVIKLWKKYHKSGNSKEVKPGYEFIWNRKIVF